MTKKAWIIFAAVCLALFGGLLYLSSRNHVDVSDVDQNSIQKAADANGNIADHVRGDTTSPVTLTQYSDYQCPYCSQAYPQVKKVVDKYGDKITYIFRNLPLTSMHPNAIAAAGAAEAAGMQDQDKYWEMHDILYQQQNDWASQTGDELTNTLVGYAKQIGLNVDQFKTDLASPNIQKKISFDRSLYAKVSDNPSTPTIILNGQTVDSDVLQNVISGDGSKLDKAVADALKK